MQQTKSYWLLVAAAGVVGTFVASACVVTTSTDGTIADGGTATGGASAGTSSGGTPAGGAASGGAAPGGSSGSTSTAGTSSGATGGAAPVSCDMGEAGAMTGNAATTCAATSGDACSACLQIHCCPEVEICNGTNPNNQCAFGGPTGDGEFTCFKACMKTAFKANGGVELIPDDLQGCAATCATDACGTVYGVSTNILVICAHADGACAVECFQ